MTLGFHLRWKRREGREDKSAYLQRYVVPTAFTGVVWTKIIHCIVHATIMAKRKSRSRSMKIQPAITTIALKTDPSTSGSYLNYVDTARELSKINRRMYEQGRLYGYQGLTFIWKASGTLATIECSVRTAGNTWITQNAFVKGKALWHQMQELVLEDNPSIAGKWHDYKLLITKNQVSARELSALDGQGIAYGAGEWNLSTYVMPQHEVDPATGLPLAADIRTACLIGQDSASIRSLVKAYEESRSTVHADSPNVPAGMETSFFNLLTDSGSQEPELALEIAAENDNPPYDLANYPGGDGNAINPVTVGYAAISAQEVDGSIGGFVAPCGLLEIEIKGYDANGLEVPEASMPDIEILLHVAPGTYKGVAAVPMGQ